MAVDLTEAEEKPFISKEPLRRSSSVMSVEHAGQSSWIPTYRCIVSCFRLDLCYVPTSPQAPCWAGIMVTPKARFISAYRVRILVAISAKLDRMRGQSFARLPYPRSVVGRVIAFACIVKLSLPSWMRHRSQTHATRRRCRIDHT